MLRTAARNSLSSEPRSRSMASFTVSLVVKGPGVKSNLQELPDCTVIFLFVAIAVVAVAIVKRRLWNHSHRRGRGGVDFFAAEVGCLENDVLNGIGRHLARILL